jgi:hypothetical protein
VETQREVDTEKSDIKSYLSERFGSDDQILGKLPGIVSKLIAEVEGSESDDISTGGPGTPDEELQERKIALQAEMEELHSEIASVAEMVVEHELRKPMNEMKERQDREITQARAAWLNYVCLKQPSHCMTLTTTDSLDARIHGQTSGLGHVHRNGC